jgi:hypothetical protein
MQRSDPQLLTWWAKYCESKGSFSKALNYYQRIGGNFTLYLASLNYICLLTNQL